MLTAYENAVKQLIQPVWSGIIPTTTLDGYINDARTQVASDGECVRRQLTITLAVGIKTYSFSSIFNPAAGYGPVIAVRMAYLFGHPLDFRSWEWFSSYYLAGSGSGQPVRLAQQGQGTNGVLYFDPLPDSNYGIYLDCVVLPAPLATDSDPEVIPQLWTDAVPLYAAWLALMQMQRQADADRMFLRYTVVMRRSRGEATGTVLPAFQPGDAGAKEAGAKTTVTSPPAPISGGGGG